MSDTFFGFKGQIQRETMFYVPELNVSVDMSDEVYENLSYNSAREYIQALATIENLAKQSLRLKELLAQEAEHECDTSCEAIKLMLGDICKPIKPIINK